MDLKSIYFGVCTNYCNDPNTVTDCWNILCTLYAEPHRHYHTFAHIEDLVNHAETVKTKIKDYDTFCFSIFYHDAIYNVRKRNNEEKSAELAETHLLKIGVNQTMIDKCIHQIIATKNHQKSLVNDTNLFLDIDMSILGSDTETYQKYSDNVRKEFNIYPRILYNRGRKKVLTKMLELPFLFHTKEYQETHENQARINIQNEIDLL